jgi:hypothetical protein
MERQKYRIRTNASQKEGFRKHRSFPVKILTAIAVLSVAMAISCPNSFALDPAPGSHNAIFWWDWGTLNISPKIINLGDTVTITATILPNSAPAQGWICAYAAWRAQGTDGVAIYYPSGCFTLLDYSPKADAHHGAGPSSGAVAWTAGTSTPPASPRLNDHCYCES